MTVSSSTNKVSYSGNGSLTTFAYTFKIFDEDDLTVILRAADGTETTQTITTHYTVTGVGEASGGNVVFGTAPASGVTVVIIREQPLTQGLDLVPNDPFPAESLEEALDKLTFMSQKHEEELSRAIKASRTNTLTGSEFTVSAADRANKVFSFDSSGNLTVTQELGTFKGDWAASTSYVERDLVKDTTTNDVFIVNAAHTSSGSLPLTTNTNSSKYDKIIDVSSPAGDLTVGGNISTTGSITGGSFVIGSANINENDLEAIDSVTAGTVAASKAVVVDVNKDISSFRNLTASGTVTYGSLSDGSITITAFVDEDNMASDSATLIPTQQSVKAYVDAQVATADALSEVLGNGNTTGGTNIVVDSGDTLDVNGALDASGNITLNGSFPTGTNNVGLGSSALASVTSTSQQNTAIGANAGDSITTGDFNTAIGFQALGGATTNSLNTAIGHNALLASVGTGNIALGGSSGLYLTSGSRNVIIGGYDGNEGGLDIRTSSNNLVLSDGDGNIRLYANSSGNVGIANVSPSTALDVTGTVTATGGAFTGNVTFGDNNKALFGAGSDLQIYHDGSNSYIDDANTGNLTIRASQINFDKYTGEAMARFRADGNTELFYDNSAKLATTSTGIDVTGTVTATGGDIKATGSLRNQMLVLERTDAANDYKWQIEGGSSGDSQYLAIVDNKGGGAAERMRIDSSGNVGIGTSSPSQKLDISAGYLNFSNGYGIRWGGNTTEAIYGHNTGNFIGFQTDGSEAMRIDISGNLLLGKTSGALGTAGSAFYNYGLVESVRDGDKLMTLNRLTSDGTIIDLRKDGSTVGSISTNGNDLVIGTNFVGVKFNDQLSSIYPYHSTGTSAQDNAVDLGYSTARFRNAYLSGGVLDGTTTGYSFISGGSATNNGSNIFLYGGSHASSANITIFRNGSSETMRIDSSGRLLVGKTSNSNSTAGTTVYANGKIEGVRDGGSVHQMNRLSSDGSILDFQKDGSTVGSIGSASSSIYVGSGDTGLLFLASGDAIRPADVSSGSSTRDNAIDLGASVARFKDLYLSGGVYLGGTGSANHLDDYEEGTYQSSLTPNTSGTITLLTAYDVLSYTKVGRAVTVTGDLVVSSTSSPVGTSVQLALPFTIGNLSELSGRIGGAVSLYDASATRTVKAYVGIEGNSYISVIVDPNTLTTSDSITISLTYFTA